MPNFFINRPVFAWVIAILICLFGIISVHSMGIDSYPDIAPPEVTVTANYPGASAQTMESTVTQVIEQQLTGIDNLLYFSSSSSSNGQTTITLTFATGTNPDIAQVQVQNKVTLAAAAAAFAGHAAGRGRGEGEPGHPDVRRAAIQQSGDRCRPSERYSRLADPAEHRPRERGRQYDAARLGIRDAHLARSRQAAKLRALDHPGAQCRERDRTRSSPPARSARTPP